MAKSFIKELIIVLLLCLAIILLLGILMYEYVPNNKTLPNEVAYTTPSSVKEELLSSSDVDDTQIIMTYEVNQDDLNNYKKVQDYKPGKANPFAASSSTESESSEETKTTNTVTGSSSSSKSSTSNASNSTSTENSSSETTNTDTSSGGSYFQNKGTK